MITRVKNASEGIIRAIAKEVERANAPMRTYGPRPGYKPPLGRADAVQQGGVRLCAPVHALRRHPRISLKTLVEQAQDAGRAVVGA